MLRFSTDIAPALTRLSLLALLASTTAAQAALDTQPPKLTSFGVSGSVDASRTGQFVSVKLGASDNLSGVYYYIIELRSPAGAIIRQEGYNTSLSKNYSTTVAIGYPRYMNIEFSEQFGRWSEPGTWSVDSIDLRDLAGNAKVYDKAALAALGNTDFLVVNAKPDAMAPTLLSGVINTPNLSLSTPPAGLPAGASPMAVLTISAEDSGATTNSGLDVYSAQFCKLPFNGSECADEFGLTGTTGTPIKTPSSLKMSGRLVRNDGTPVTPGTYVLSVITLQDIASNASAWVSTAVGGSVDFNAYFGGGITITVAP
ncbi:hypothetical protein [Ideonella sp.]|uniref:hypothetical protein n=1 Tax=Ideonella sp. TaxID=1929293 RepID=UPI003BB55A29